ncbi:hypothetical protein MATL_G00084400 [Megalops atlanticus]|uniref:BPTI/Kunitz inhibitor domain-containing protein n=1 Tax=Megalops atlanticus TaxID=7932 RepID=A0A9D3TDU1_MEGAT|nr:hypothetical protein MATL_G00084400 [Megalops atlanticus]
MKRNLLFALSFLAVMFGTVLSMAKVCELPMEEGPCSARQLLYYYDSQERTCRTFFYGGCRGNGNRFEALEKCQQTCMGRSRRSANSGPHPDEPTVNTAEVCELPMEKGPCSARQLLYYYDSQERTCRTFSFGGCRGNGNRFETLEKCQQTCMGRSRRSANSGPHPDEPTVNTAEVCELPMEKGPCWAMHLLYYYDSQERTCRTFFFGGCRGNGNRFKTLKKCHQTCMGRSRRSANSGPHPDEPTVNTAKVCELPTEEGPCSARQLLYYYDSQERTCRTFFYGGCRGNGNRFETLEKCQQTCMGRSRRSANSGPHTDEPTVNTDKRCTNTKDEGTGNEQQLKYYFEGSMCLPFFYKGEGGNDNRFNNESECIWACRNHPENLYPEGAKVCELPMEQGPCYGRQLLYYYNSQEKTCRAFLYGGCGGNGNRFEAMEKCQQTCMGKSGRSANSGPHPDEPTVNTGLIAGVVGGCVFAVAMVAAIALFITDKTRDRKKVPTKEVEMS